MGGSSTLPDSVNPDVALGAKQGQERYSQRRLLVPFSGSGSEMIGGVHAGWDEVTGIELSSEYAAIAEARLEHWASQEAVSKVA